MNPISCLSFLYVPCHFTMYGEKFISQWNYLNLWRLALCFPSSKIFAAKKVASFEKSRLVENRLYISKPAISRVLIGQTSHAILCPLPRTRIKLVAVMTNLCKINNLNKFHTFQPIFLNKHELVITLIKENGKKREIC